jgi:hypothetical protein
MLKDHLTRGSLALEEKKRVVRALSPSRCPHEAAQRLQSRSRLRGRCVATHAGRVDSFSDFPSPGSSAKKFFGGHGIVLLARIAAQRVPERHEFQLPIAEVARTGHGDGKLLAGEILVTNPGSDYREIFEHHALGRIFLHR